MKKFILFFFVMILLRDCLPGNGPIPNPGFRIYAEEIYDDDRPSNYLRGSATSGDWAADLVGYVTGTEKSFVNKIAEDGTFDVANGRSPSTWYFRAISGWKGCDGDAAYVNIPEAGHGYEVSCHHIGGFHHVPLFPRIVSPNQAVELQSTIENIDTSHGLPIFQFEDYQGNVIALTTATQVNGTDVRLSSSGLLNKSPGTYNVKIYNAPDQNANSNSSANQPIGFSEIVVQLTPSAPTNLSAYGSGNVAGTSWTNHNTTASSQNIIEYSQNGGGWSSFGTVAGNVSSYSRQLSSTTGSCAFRVRNTDVPGQYSNTATLH